jgi:hypothetical protein
MEFGFDCEELFNTDPNGYVVLQGRELGAYSGVNSYTAGVKFKQGEKIFDKRDLTPMDKLASMVDRMGCASAAVMLG